MNRASFAAYVKHELARIANQVRWSSPTTCPPTNRPAPSLATPPTPVPPPPAVRDRAEMRSAIPAAHAPALRGQGMRRLPPWAQRGLDRDNPSAGPDCSSGTARCPGTSLPTLAGWGGGHRLPARPPLLVRARQTWRPPSARRGFDGKVPLLPLNGGGHARFTGACLQSAFGMGHPDATAPQPTSARRASGSGHPTQHAAPRTWTPPLRAGEHHGNHRRFAMLPRGLTRPFVLPVHAPGDPARRFVTATGASRRAGDGPKLWSCLPPAALPY